MDEKKQGDVDVFKWFKGHVIESKLEPSIEHEELVSGQTPMNHAVYLIFTLLEIDITLCFY